MEVLIFPYHNGLSKGLIRITPHFTLIPVPIVCNYRVSLFDSKMVVMETIQTICKCLGSVDVLLSRFGDRLELYLRGRRWKYPAEILLRVPLIFLMHHWCVLSPTSSYWFIEIFLFIFRYLGKHVRIQRGGGGRGSGPPPPLKNYRNIGFLSINGLDPLKITKLPSQHAMLGHYRLASETPFKWRFAGGSMVAR